MNKKQINGYIELTKPSIMILVLVTTALGFYFAEGGIHHPWLLMYTLMGAALTCAGAGALNHYLERDSDALMKRTRNRPVPSGLITPEQALGFGVSLILLGLMILCVKVNLLTAFLSLLTAFLYVLVYTPMKKISWLNTTIGAIPGAIPPMGGWAAARGELGVEAWVLFFILFAWQHPHFYAIAWMFKEDYKKAGFKMLPVVYPDSWFTMAQIMAFSFALIGFSIMPSMIGMAGRVYFWGALILGVALIWYAWKFQQSPSNLNARKILGASVIYLPLLLLLIIFDNAF
ncbi:MAG: protoheme IX farnesyltransferase [Candidatus Omnitrophica bacterium]|nr:protoheme IX farnesyltransferase [Candidatus Omnitrophota bacterium]